MYSMNNKQVMVTVDVLVNVDDEGLSNDDIQTESKDWVKHVLVESLVYSPQWVDAGNMRRTPQISSVFIHSSDLVKG